MVIVGGGLSILTRLGAPFQSLLKGAPPVIKDVIRTTPRARFPVKTVAVTSSIFGTTALLTQTPGGQQFTSQTLEATNNITRFFSKNEV